MNSQMKKQMKKIKGNGHWYNEQQNKKDKKRVWKIMNMNKMKRGGKYRSKCNKCNKINY
jgi:hypothetical protein